MPTAYWRKTQLVRRHRDGGDPARSPRPTACGVVTGLGEAGDDREATSVPADDVPDPDDRPDPPRPRATRPRPD
jgi:hypothetical protein